MMPARRLAGLTPAERTLYQAGYDAALQAFAHGEHTPRNPCTGQRDPAAQYAALRGLVRALLTVYYDSLRQGAHYDTAVVEALHRCDHASYHTAGPAATPPTTSAVTSGPRPIRRGAVVFLVGTPGTAMTGHDTPTGRSTLDREGRQG